METAKESDRVYSDDSRVPYKTSELSPQESRMEIEAILAKYGIKQTAWNWDPEHNEIWIGFNLQENINGQAVATFVKVQAPLIWDHPSQQRRGSVPKHGEILNWRISLRIMFWYIKNNLAMSYMWQIKKSAAFLNFMRNAADQPIGDVILSRIQEIQLMPALQAPAGKEGPLNVTHALESNQS